MESTIPVANTGRGGLLASPRAPWVEPLLAALPHLWIGIAAAAIRLIASGAPEVDAWWLSGAASVALMVFMAASLAAAVYAWRGSWPLWSASWFFYTAWILVILFGLGINYLVPHAWVLNAALILGSLAGMAVGYLMLFRRARRHAALAALFLMPVATQLELEAIPDAWEAVIALAFGILAAGAAIGIVRNQSWFKGVIGALGANGVAGLLLTYVCFYRAEIPNFYGDSFLEASLAFLIYVGLAVALFVGPAIFWSVVERLRRAIKPRGEASIG